MADAQRRSSGLVRWFNGQKGFGFIAPDGGGDDLFVHQTDIRSDGFRTLREGQKVEFAVESSEDGRSKAVDVISLTGSYRSGGRGDGRRGSGRSGGYGRGYGGRGGQRDGRIIAGGGEGMACYNCGKVGHLARDCYRYGGSSGGNWVYRGGVGGKYGGQSGGGGGGGGGGGVCYSCGEEGHLARNCPN